MEIIQLGFLYLEHGRQGRGCKSVGSCIAPGKGQFVAFKCRVYKYTQFVSVPSCAHLHVVRSDGGMSKEGNEGCSER